jgi:hypothetical protein
MKYRTSRPNFRRGRARIQSRSSCHSKTNFDVKVYQMFWHYQTLLYIGLLPKKKNVNSIRLIQYIRKIVRNSEVGANLVSFNEIKITYKDRFFKNKQNC